MKQLKTKFNHFINENLNSNTFELVKGYYDICSFLINIEDGVDFNEYEYINFNSMEYYYNISL